VHGADFDDEGDFVQILQPPVRFDKFLFFRNIKNLIHVLLPAFLYNTVISGKAQLEREVRGSGSVVNKRTVFIS